MENDVCPPTVNQRILFVPIFQCNFEIPLDRRKSYQNRGVHATYFIENAPQLIIPPYVIQKNMVSKYLFLLKDYIILKRLQIKAKHLTSIYCLSSKLGLYHMQNEILEFCI